MKWTTVVHVYKRKQKGLSLAILGPQGVVKVFYHHSHLFDVIRGGQDGSTHVEGSGGLLEARAGHRHDACCFQQPVGGMALLAGPHREVTQS